MRIQSVDAHSIGSLSFTAALAKRCLDFYLTCPSPTMQHTLVSPGGSRGGRRSGDVTPVEGQGGGGDEVYYTWHAGAPHPSAQARTRNPDTARSV